ncbi:hypothetical protein MESS4_330077 [Mesorhizobium sp. STM 4661]|nr:hypothetical protein MESS4_330077 [Mesorhizobium sp. STM 4661]
MTSSFGWTRRFSPARRPSIRSPGLRALRSCSCWWKCPPPLEYIDEEFLVVFPGQNLLASFHNGAPFFGRKIAFLAICLCGCYLYVGQSLNDEWHAFNRDARDWEILDALAV